MFETLSFSGCCSLVFTTECSLVPLCQCLSQCLDLVVLKISKYYKGQEWVSENMDYNSGMLLNSCHLGEINSLCLNFMLFMKTENQPDIIILFIIKEILYFTLQYQLI